MSMKCSPGLSGSLKEKPSWKIETSRRKRKDRKREEVAAEKEKIKNRKRKVGKQSLCF